MKKNKLLLTAGMFGLALTSCSKDPVACFTLDKTTAAVNTPIVADASCSVDAGKYMWMESEGSTFEGTTRPEVAIYTYSEPGNYTIRLKVKSESNGNETEISKPVTITE